MTRARELANFADDTAGLETLTVSDITDLSVSASNINSATNQITDSSTDLNVDSNTLVVDKSANRVGIGRNDPQTILDIAHSGSSNSGAVRIGDPSTISNNTSIYMRTTGDATIGTGGGDIVFDTNIGSAPRMRIQHSSGNVGIGTVNPVAPLTVQSNSGAEAVKILGRNADDIGQMLFVEADGTTRLGRIDARTTYLDVASDNALYLSAGGVGTKSIAIDSSGNVGIGTNSPSQLLDVYSSTSGTIARITGPNAYDAESGLEFSVGRAKISGFLNTTGGTPGSSLRFYTMPDGGSVTEKMRIDSSGHITPGADNTQDFGSSSKRWQNIYTGDLHLSNEGSVNDVDGTSGDWTIQEGSEDLFLINNKSGKKYKFNMEEV